MPPPMACQQDMGTGAEQSGLSGLSSVDYNTISRYLCICICLDASDQSQEWAISAIPNNPWSKVCDLSCIPFCCVTELWGHCIPLNFCFP